MIPTSFQLLYLVILPWYGPPTSSFDGPPLLHRQDGSLGTARANPSDELCCKNNGAGEISPGFTIEIIFHQQCEYNHSTIISLFFRKSPSKVTLGQVQLEWFPGTLMGTTLTTSSIIYVENMVNMLPINILNSTIWSIYSVVAARFFFMEGYVGEVN